MLSKKTVNRYKEQAAALVAQMTLDEKVSQMEHDAPSIPRLGIKSYNWWNEALHGVARAGVATVFPQAIALAASFDDEMIFKIGDIVSTEGRAKFHESQRKSDHGIYKGLTFWAPNINIFRDPRWGRGHETYGEDPVLTGKMGIAYIKGLQGNDTGHLKASACIKHYAVHSGPESLRHGFDATVSQKDLYETYLPAFKACVKEAGVESVMGAYNSINGEACCASKHFIGEVLRKGFGFDGHFVSDCGAIHNLFTYHHVANSLTEAVAMSAQAGCDLNCGSGFKSLLVAAQTGLVKESEIDECVIRLMTARYKLGILGDEGTAFDDIPYSANNAKEHNAAALKAAESCMTLLKNDGILPVCKDSIKRIAVIGPNADSRTVLQGNYNGTASRYHTVLSGIQDYLGEAAEVIYAQGCHLFSDKVEACAESSDRLAEAVSAAQCSDMTVLCIGLDPTMEGEAGDAYNGDASGDKVDLLLPASQRELMEAVLSTGQPVIVVSLCGSAIDLSPAKDKAAAIVQAWYPGAHGGTAVARLIFGEYSPAGRLPVTFYKSSDDLPEFVDYNMQGRTYRYFDGEVLYPFGYGLSYTTFVYNKLTMNRAELHTGESVCCRCTVTNTGSFDSDEVVQLYLKDEKTSTTAPRYQLKGFKRIHLEAGKSMSVEFVLSPEDMELVLDDGSSVIEQGDFTVYVGGGQPGTNTLSTGFKVI